MSRAVKAPVLTPEAVANLRIAYKRTLANLATMATLQAIDECQAYYNLNNTQRNLLVELVKSHKRRLCNTKLALTPDDALPVVP